MSSNLISVGLAAVGVAMLLAQPSHAAKAQTFGKGDLVVSFEDGSVQWRKSNGALVEKLPGAVPGPAEGMRFNAAGHLFVSHWCVAGDCTRGNTIEQFDTHGHSLGTIGTEYDCNPHAIDFDSAGAMYVGQADCTGQILKFSMGLAPVAFAVAGENRGSFWVDLAADGCTVLYTSWGPDVLRYNACLHKQLSNFNAAPMPGGETHGLSVLSDGGVLVSSGAQIVRLNALGTAAHTYSVPGESQYWAGLDLVGDGTFWAVNYYTSMLHRFNLATGALVQSIDTGAPVATTVDVRARQK